MISWLLRLRFCCLVSLCYCTPVIPSSSSFFLLFFWLLFPSICPSQRVYLAVLLLFDLRFFPNFPPSLPRALSYSQDIKVIHAKDLIKGLTVPKYNHSTLCFVHFCRSSLYLFTCLVWFWFRFISFHFIVLSFLHLSFSKLSVFIFYFSSSYHTSCSMSLFLASNIYLSVCFFLLHH